MTRKIVLTLLRLNLRKAGLNAGCPMYIVNTSFFIGYDAHDKWTAFMKEKYIPFLRGSGYHNIRFCRVIAEAAGPEGFTYCLMVDCPDMEHYGRLTGELFTEYKNIAVPMFGDAVQWFTSLLKEQE